MKKAFLVAIVAACTMLLGCSGDDYSEIEKLGEPVEIIQLTNFTYILNDPEMGTSYIIDADEFVLNGFDEAYRIELPTESEANDADN